MDQSESLGDGGDGDHHLYHSQCLYIFGVAAHRDVHGDGRAGLLGLGLVRHGCEALARESREAARLQRRDGDPARPLAGAGLLAGTAIGSDNARHAANDVQAAYSDAYYACMHEDQRAGYYDNGAPRPGYGYGYGPPPPAYYYPAYAYPYPYYYSPGISLGFGFGGGWGHRGWGGGHGWGGGRGFHGGGFRHR